MSTADTREQITFKKRIGVERTLVALSHHRDGKGGHVFGLKVDEVMRQTGLDEQEALQTLEELERLKICGPHTCQESTAGPYAIRYRLVEGVEVSVTVTRLPKQ